MEEIKKKYIIANIKIPIDIENNEIKYLNEYANVTFDTSYILPQKTSTEIDVDTLLKLLKNDEDTTNLDTNKIFLNVTKEELKHYKKSKNISFKNRHITSTRYSRKNI